MILLTGATGFVGQEVVTALLSLGQPLRLLVRQPERARKLALLGVEIVPGDLLEPATLTEACRGVETVVHLVGIIAETRTITFQQAHVEATAQLLAAARTAGVKRFVHMSALGTRPEARSEYHRTKWAAEERVRASGLAWTIFRPSLIYGYDRRERLFLLLRRLLTPPGSWLFLHSFALLNGGHMQVQPIGVRQVARAFAQAVVQPESSGQTYALTGPEPMSFRSLVEQVVDATGQNSSYESWPFQVIFRGGVALALLIAAVAIFLARSPLGLVPLLLLPVWLTLPQRIVLFSFSSRWVWPLAHLLDRLAPRWLRFRAQLLMLEEDNIGDPLPAVRQFGLTQETLGEALARLFDT